jgi:glutathione S-transferase
VPIRLYSIPLSPPAYTARLALERKGLAYRNIQLIGGFHPPVLRGLGFKGVTVPAMKLEDGTKVQGSLEITQALERIAADGPPLFPADPGLRRRVEAAERWGENVLQEVPRRIIRWTLNKHLSQRQWFADVASPLPFPKVMGVALTPLVPLFVRQAGAYDEPVRADVANIRGHLDHVDSLIADGVIGTPEINAADCQIAGCLAVVSAFEDLEPLFAGRPCLGLTRRLIPDFPPIPAVLPDTWVAAA